MNAEKHAAEMFKVDTAQHEMTILREDGLYRHLRFRRPDRTAYWFDLITWPMVLTISGDMGCFVFCRLEDMFEFFRGSGSHYSNGINPQYWAEKLRADSGVKEYSEQRFREQVAQAVEDWGNSRGLKQAVEEQILSSDDIGYEDGARLSLNAFDYADFRFEHWDWDLTDWTHHFLWCCHAIQWGISQYDAERAVAAGGEAG